MWSGGLYAGVDARADLLVEVAKVDLSITAARGRGVPRAIRERARGGSRW